MNKKLKQDLKTVFDAPRPSRKEAFLKGLAFPKASRFDFVTTQIGYIRKRYWLGSLGLFGLVLSVLYKSETPLTAVWVIASILPFLGLLSCTELVRSMSYNMAELEMSCKHHFSEIMLLRLTLLGAVQAVVLIAMLMLVGPKIPIGFWHMAFYMLTPFLINTYMTLILLNRLQSRETLPICAAVTGGISLINAVVMSQNSGMLTAQYKVLGEIIFIVLIGVIAYEIRKMIKETEELRWNLLLTA